jgi:RimJ/RimL family protein N-acetyltransferase
MSTSTPPVVGSAAYPVLRSPRFRFRPFVYSDIELLSALASQHRIADSTVGIPHPYTTEFARMWIASHSAPGRACTQASTQRRLDRGHRVLGARA